MTKIIVTPHNQSTLQILLTLVHQEVLEYPVIVWQLQVLLLDHLIPD